MLDVFQQFDWSATARHPLVIGLVTDVSMYVAMICAMIGVGALEQLLFCVMPKDTDKRGKPSPGKNGQ